MQDQTRTGVRNQINFYNGHYCCYALNVQAVCDGNAKSIAFRIEWPGGTADAKALIQSELFEYMKKLDDIFFFIGDNGYKAFKFLTIPFTKNFLQGSEAVWRDSFNYFLSSLRIIIERVFGMLVSKLGIFKSPLVFDLASTTLTKYY